MSACDRSRFCAIGIWEQPVPTLRNVCIFHVPDSAQVLRLSRSLCLTLQKCCACHEICAPIEQSAAPGSSFHLAAVPRKFLLYFHCFGIYVRESPPTIFCFSRHTLVNGSAGVTHNRRHFFKCCLPDPPVSSCFPPSSCASGRAQQR